MKPVDDGLFAHIKESLTAHEEAYVPGAWERFGKREGKKMRWLWFTGLGSAAAALLVGIVVFFSEQKSANPLQNNDSVSTNIVKPGASILGDVKAEINTAPDKVKKVNPKVASFTSKGHRKINNNLVIDPLIVANERISGHAEPVTTLVATVKDSLIIANNKADPPTVAVDNPTRSFQDFLQAEVNAGNSVAAAKLPAKKIDKWEMGLMVAPSIGNGKKVNMGYGVSMGFALSDKLLISSGISYNELTASKSTTSDEYTQNAPTSMAVVNDTKSLESVDANLVGIDIPLGIKYYVTKKFYTNLGVSAFAVLNQRQNNNYLKGTVEHDASNGAEHNGFTAVFKTRTVSEEVPAEETKENRYLGFYNISFGFQQKISGSKAFSVEPFLKLPMKQFSKENLDLMGTGLRLKFDF